MDGNTSIRVVVVDDQMLVREGLRRVFEAANGFEMVGECADGDEVVDVVTKLTPDVVLLDMRLRRLNGDGAMRQLGALAQRPPVLVLTTYDDDETLTHALVAGAEGFMLKESVSLDLLRAVDTVAHGGAWIDPAVAGQVLAVYRRGIAPTKKPVDLRGLTAREVEVLRFIALGRTNREIAAALVISERTVKAHIGHLFTKLDVRDRVGAVLRAYEAGVAEPPQ